MATRRNSPLVIGLGENKRTSSAPDVSAFIDYTKGSRRNGSGPDRDHHRHRLLHRDFEGNPAEGAKPFHIEWDAAAAEKGGFNSFSLEKEIHEQPAAVEQTLMGASTKTFNLTLDELNIDDSVLRSIDQDRRRMWYRSIRRARWHATPSSTGARIPTEG